MTPFDLSGRVAIVTGGNGGIGLGMARGLASAGAAVVVAGRNAEKNAAAVTELEALGANRLVFNDADVARASGLLDPREPAGRWILFDPTLRVLAIWKLEDAATAVRAFNGAPSPDRHSGSGAAPVLVAPNVFELDFCKRLTDYYRTQGAAPSGITQQDTSGRTFVSLDDTFKRRSDCLIEDEKLRDAIMQRIYWRLSPMIERAFTVRSTDPTEARYLLSPSLMQRIAAFNANSGSQLRLGFLRGRVYVAIPMREGFLELNPLKPLMLEDIRKWAGELLFAISVVDELDLNTRIWSKAPAA